MGALGIEPGSWLFNKVNEMKTMMMNIDTTCHLNGNLLQQVALERHVNAHFNQEVGQNGNGNSSQGVKRECAPAKLVRRNSKKSKYRRSKAAPGTVPSISIIDNLFIIFSFFFVILIVYSIGFLQRVCLITSIRALWNVCATSCSFLRRVSNDSVSHLTITASPYKARYNIQIPFIDSAI